MAKLPALRAREAIRILEKAGFRKWRQKGGRLTMYRPTDRRALTVPMHFTKTVPKGTLRAIIKEAGLTVEEFNALRTRRSH